MGICFGAEEVLCDLALVLLEAVHVEGLVEVDLLQPAFVRRSFGVAGKNYVTP